jgi:hypothetical protein
LPFRAHSRSLQAEDSGSEGERGTHPCLRLRNPVIQGGTRPADAEDTSPRRPLAPALTARFTLAPDRDRRRTLRALADGLADLEHRADDPRVQVREVQLVRAASYDAMEGSARACLATRGVDNGRMAEAH